MQVRILGPFHREEGGRRITVSGIRQCAVLADLLLHANEVGPSEQLLVDLWGEDAPPGAANALQAATSRLRRLLPPGRLIPRAPGYTLRIFLEELDVKQFERLLSGAAMLLQRGAAEEAPQALGQALSLWQDPALADFAEAGILLQRQGVSLASCFGLATGEALITAAVTAHRACLRTGSANMSTT